MGLDTYYQKRYSQFLQRLRAARLEAGLSQEQVAVQLGKPQSFVSRSETGERRVDVVELQAFARLYKKAINHFILAEE